MNIWKKSLRPVVFVAVALTIMLLGLSLSSSKMSTPRQHMPNNTTANTKIVNVEDAFTGESQETDKDKAKYRVTGLVNKKLHTYFIVGNKAPKLDSNYDIKLAVNDKIGSRYAGLDSKTLISFYDDQETAKVAKANERKKSDDSATRVAQWAVIAVLITAGLALVMKFSARLITPKMQAKKDNKL